MAKPRKHVSLATEDNVKGGGQFGFPPNSTVKITEAKFTTWEEAVGAEKAAKRKYGSPEDPCLHLVGEVEGIDDPRDVTLGAGKKDFMVPSDDGEFLEPVEAAEGINDGCALAHFCNSLQDKKTLGKLAYSATEMNQAVSEAFVGLVFVAGTKTVDRSDMPDRDPKKGDKDKVLIAIEIVEKPGTEAPKKKKAVAKAEPEDEAEEEEEEKPKGKKGGGDTKVDLEEHATELVVATLSDPKNRKGIAKSKLFSSVYAKHQDDNDPHLEKAMDKFIGDDDWVTDSDRPWEFDKAAKLFTLPS